MIAFFNSSLDIVAKNSLSPAVFAPKAERLLPVFVLLRNLKFKAALFCSQTSHHFCFSFNKNDYTTIFPVSQVSILEHPVQIPFRFWSRELQIFSQKSQIHSVIPNICALPGFFQGGGRLQPQGLSALRQAVFFELARFLL